MNRFYSRRQPYEWHLIHFLRVIDYDCGATGIGLWYNWDRCIIIIIIIVVVTLSIVNHIHLIYIVNQISCIRSSLFVRSVMNPQMTSTGLFINSNWICIGIGVWLYYVHEYWTIWTILLRPVTSACLTFDSVPACSWPRFVDIVSYILNIFLCNTWWIDIHSITIASSTLYHTILYTHNIIHIT